MFNEVPNKVVFIPSGENSFWKSGEFLEISSAAAAAAPAVSFRCRQSYLHKNKKKVFSGSPISDKIFFCLSLRRTLLCLVSDISDREIGSSVDQLRKGLVHILARLGSEHSVMMLIVRRIFPHLLPLDPIRRYCTTVVGFEPTVLKFQKLTISS